MARTMRLPPDKQNDTKCRARHAATHEQTETKSTTVLGEGERVTPPMRECLHGMGR
jgi:hypothetical protein